MEIDYKAIGQRIKIARIKKGITQEAVQITMDCEIQLRFFFSAEFISHTPDSDNISWIVWVWFDF